MYTLSSFKVTKTKLFKAAALGLAFVVAVVIIGEIRNEVESQENTPTKIPSPTPTFYIQYVPPTVTPTPNIKYIELDDMSVPEKADGKKKTYMDYNTISLKTSKQYMLQQLSTTDSDGFRRFQGKYMIALGSYYAGRIGDEYIIEFEHGEIVAVLGDYKQDIHTDHTNRYVLHNENIIEFIVDTEVAKKDNLINGDVSDIKEHLQGKVIKISRVIWE